MSRFKVDDKKANRNQNKRETTIASIKLNLSKKINTTRNSTHIEMPKGIDTIALVTYETSFTRAMKIKLTKILEGRFEIKPPTLLPNFSANKVDIAIQVPAIRNELTTLMINN